MDNTPKISAVITDDELLTRLDFAQMLTEMGIDVVGEASDGFDAVEICREKKPDLVLMDLRMPVFDGYGATDLIIREKIAGSVIVISAYDDEDLIRKAIESGVDNYLIKPVDKRALFIAVEIALQRQSRRKTLEQKSRKAEQALEDYKIIDRAKAKLAEDEKISEAEAYRIIQKQAMDKQVSMRDIANHILAFDEQKETVNDAKHLLMQKKQISEKQAYQILQQISEVKRRPLVEVALTLLQNKDII